jgi:hypothetical protein
VWYDSALVTQKAQLRTFEMMQAISESRKVNLQMMDIRQLPNIENKEKKLYQPGTNVYSRVDFTKAKVSEYYMMQPEEDAGFCVVSDIDVEPMTPEHLFDQRTLEFLSTNGYVFNRVGHSELENSFFIFKPRIEKIIKLHKKRVTKNVVRLIKTQASLNAQSVYRGYFEFVRAMGEEDKEGTKEEDLLEPRKVVKCPPSQFNWGGGFSREAFQKESFRFIRDDEVPYTMNGRAYRMRQGEEAQLFKEWKCEPLPPLPQPA